MAAIWNVGRTQSARFPVRIAIEQGGRVLFAVRAQSEWPAPGGQIFCLRERELDLSEPLEPLARVPIVTLKRMGPKIAVVLVRRGPGARYSATRGGSSTRSSSQP